MQRTLTAALAGLAFVTGAAAPGNAADCIVIAHRGASGYLPEHTAPAYRLAALLGPDYLEPDLVMTRDGVLVARHEAALAATTDVADHPGFASHRHQRTVAGRTIDDWWSDDFTLAELRTLRVRERIPDVRPGNAGFDGLFSIPTFTEILDLRESLSRELGRPVGVYPELKSPGAFRSRGLDPEAALVRELAGRNLTSRTSPVIVQSFEPDSLQRLRTLTRLRLVQLLPLTDDPGEALPAPAAIARYADGIGAARWLLTAPDGTPQPLLASAATAGLFVHAWTFRRETALGDRPAAGGPLPSREAAIAEMRRHVALGVTGVFTDQPDLGAAACQP